MDLIREVFAYQVCTTSPLWLKVLLDTEILRRWKETQFQDRSLRFKVHNASLLISRGSALVLGMQKLRFPSPHHPVLLQIWPWQIALPLLQELPEWTHRESERTPRAVTALVCPANDGSGSVPKPRVHSCVSSEAPPTPFTNMWWWAPTLGED